MPSPIGHTLAGCAVALALIPPDTPQVWEAWALCLMSANLADLDFLPGLLVGQPKAYHRGPSHSLVAALLAAGLGASVLAWPCPRAGLILLAYASHVGLDYGTPGRGVLLGWPFSRRRFQAARPWFLGLSLRRGGQGLGEQNRRWPLLRAIGREVLLVAPGVALLALARGLGWLPLGAFD